MEAGIAAARLFRLFQFKEPEGFKRPLEHSEAQEGLQPRLLGVGRQCRSDEGKERHWHKLEGILALQAMFTDSLWALGLTQKSFSWRPVEKCSPLGCFLQGLVLQELGGELTAICQRSRFHMELSWTEAPVQSARMKWPDCRNSWSNSFGGINHISLLTPSPHSHQGGCAGQAGFLLSSWQGLCEAPAWRLQPLFKAQQHSSNVKAAEVMEEYRFYSIVCSSAVSWYIKALLSLVASAGRRPVWCPFISDKGPHTAASGVEKSFVRQSQWEKEPSGPCAPSAGRL